MSWLWRGINYSLYCCFVSVMGAERRVDVGAGITKVFTYYRRLTFKLRKAVTWLSCFCKGGCGCSIEWPCETDGIIIPLPCGIRPIIEGKPGWWKKGAEGKLAPGRRYGLLGNWGWLAGLIAPSEAEIEQFVKSTERLNSTKLICL